MKKAYPETLRTWFVTGASSGVGLELCRQLLEGGYQVVAIARRAIPAKHPHLLSLTVDVTDARAVKNAVACAIGHFGRVDVLVNNAGISSYLTIEEESMDKMRKVMETNFWGAFHTMQALIPHFRDTGHGTIVNNTSICGLVARAFGAAYCSSKFALEGLSSVARQELQRFCRVMTVNLSYFPGTEIQGQQKRGSDIPEYRGLPWVPVKSSVSYESNQVDKAVRYIIETVGNEILPRNLILGVDVEEQALYAIREKRRDWQKSKEMAWRCGAVSNFYKNTRTRRIIRRMCLVLCKLVLGLSGGRSEWLQRRKRKLRRSL